MKNSKIQKMVTIITGASSGIAKHFATRLNTDEHHLILTDIIPSEGVQPHDVRSQEQWETLFNKTISKWGKIDYLFNIAGYAKPNFIENASLSEIEEHFDINTKGTLIGSTLAAQYMIKQGYGHIVNISSLAGVAPIPGLSFYCASKFAVRGFSLALATELKDFGVHVSVVCPDVVRTPMVESHYDSPAAALIFSGNRMLSVTEIGDVLLQQVMAEKKIEVLIPATRGWLAKVASAFPWTSNLLYQRLSKKGQRRQLSEKQKILAP